MQVVYMPENIIDAHLIKGLLASVDIDSFIRGEHLVGAIGELPALGLLAVMVADEDLDAARALIQDWDRAEIETEPTPDEGSFMA